MTNLKQYAKRICAVPLSLVMLSGIFPTGSVLAEESSEAQPCQLTVSVTGPGTAKASVSDQIITPEQPLSIEMDKFAEYTLGLDADEGAVIQRMSVNGYTVTDIPDDTSHFTFDDGFMDGDQDVKVYFTSQDTETAVLSADKDSQDAYDSHNFSSVSDNGQQPLGRLSLDAYWYAGKDQETAGVNGAEVLYLNNDRSAALSGGVNISLNNADTLEPGQFQMILPDMSFKYQITDPEIFGLAQNGDQLILVNKKPIDAGGHEWNLNFDAESIMADGTSDKLSLFFPSYLVSGDTGYKGIVENGLFVNAGSNNAALETQSWGGAVITNTGKLMSIVSNYTLKNPYIGYMELINVTSTSQGESGAAYCVMPEVPIEFGTPGTEYDLQEWMTKYLNGQHAMTQAVAEQMCAGYFYLLNLQGYELQNYNNAAMNAMQRDDDLFRSLMQTYLWRTMGSKLPYISSNKSPIGYDNLPANQNSNIGVLYGNGYTVCSSAKDVNYATQMKLYHDMDRFYNENKNKPASFFGGMSLRDMAYSMRFYVRNCDQVNAVNGMDQGVTTFFKIKKVEKGKFRIKKESEYDLSGGINNNNNYSMVGAKFDVYTSDKKEKIATLTVGNDLYTEYTPDLTPGTYVVEETAYGNGFVPELNQYWKPVSFTVDVTAGNKTMTVTRKNRPVYAPSNLKIAAKTNDSDKSPLAGALLEVKYYASDSVTDTPTRTWYLRTDTNGEIKIGQATESWNGKDSDPWYINPYGNACLPLGTLKITEVQAPDGYLIADTAEATVRILNKNPSSGDQNTVLNWTNVTLDAPTFVDKPITVDLVKTQSGTGTPLAGAVFRLTKPDGSTVEVATDDNGKLTLGPLEAGKHTLQEIKAPAGYQLNSAVVSFTVEAGKGVTGWEGLEQAGMSADGNTINVPNIPNYVPFEIIKTNDIKENLQGAVFGIYIDKDCTELIRGAQSYPGPDGDVMGFITDENGVIQAKLEANKQYYIKELVAPDGYSLSRDTQGKVHVYEVKFNVSADNKFSVTLDGKDYTETTDSVTIGQDGDTWTVNLNIVNERGHQLPDTGGNEWLFFAGMVVLVGFGAILLKQRRSARI